MRQLRSAAACVAISSSVFAGPPDAGRIARHMDESSLAAVHVDLERLDLGTFLDAVKSSKAGAGEAVGEVRDEWVGWLRSMRSAGAREMIVLASIRMDERGPVGIVVPLHAGADAAGIMKGIANLDPRVAGDAVIAGLDDPAGEPDSARVARVAAALKAGGEGDASVVVLPSEFARRALAELAPVLPGMMGGGPTSRLTDGLVWAGGSVSLPPDGKARVRVQSKDPAAAQAFADLVRLSLAGAAAEVEKEGRIPSFRDLIGRVSIKPEADAVVLALDADGARAASVCVAEALQAARETARLMVVASTIRAALMGCNIYAADNREQWPENLSKLIELGMLGAEATVTKRHEGGEIVYRRPTPEQVRKSPSVAVMHEGFKAWPRGGLWVGFADGHVELVGTEEEFRKTWARW